MFIIKYIIKFIYICYSIFIEPSEKIRFFFGDICYFWLIWNMTFLHFNLFIYICKSKNSIHMKQHIFTSIKEYLTHQDFPKVLEMARLNSTDYPYAIFINGYSITGGRSEHNLPHFSLRMPNLNASYIIPSNSEWLENNNLTKLTEQNVPKNIEDSIIKWISAKTDGVKNLNRLHNTWNELNSENPNLKMFDSYGEYINRRDYKETLLYEDSSIKLKKIASKSDGSTFKLIVNYDVCNIFVSKYIDNWKNIIFENIESLDDANNIISIIEDNI